MIVLSEDSPAREMTPSARENHACTEAAKLFGLRVYYIPVDFADCGDADGALAYVPAQGLDTVGVWIGYIPDPDRYRSIHAASLERRIRLINDPDEHLRAQEFDRAYAYLLGLTPESVVLTSVDECEAAVRRLGLPVFVKGAVQSRKSRGWKACVAESLPELQRLVDAHLALPGRSRGRVIVRKLASLRYVQSSPEGFPFGREYRVFLYNDQVLQLGYYWEGDDPLERLSPDEDSKVRQLAVEASRRLAVPYVSIDIGQTTSGEWIVIESGDGQFSGLSKISTLQLWSALARIESADTVE